MALPRVLLIDDDEDNNYLVTHWIKKENLASSIDSVLNGEEGIAYLKDKPNPNYILLDINMPRMNGWEFLDEYKKLPEEMKSSSTVIIVTVSENPEDKEKATRENLKFVNKPLTVEILKKLIKEH